MFSTQEKDRIAWIDVAKGICMICVVAGHLSVPEINNVVFSFHLTVFFLLSGYTLKKTDLDSAYLNKKFRSLMIPYFMTCVCIMMMDVFNQIWWYGGTSIENITGVISRDIIRSFMASGSIRTLGSVEIGSRIGAIWFLPALFFALIFTQLILKYIQSKTYRFAVGFGLMILAMITGEFIWFPFSIQSAMAAVPFILIGYELRQCDFLNKLNWKYCLCFLALFLLCLQLQKTKIYFVTATFDDVLISFIAGMSMSFVVLFVSRKLERCRALSWIGRHSLIFLCVHLFEMETMGKWFQLILESLSFSYTEFPRFCIKLIFITAVTSVIVFLKKNIHFQTAADIADERNGRDCSIDIARGILIALILIGHFSVESNFRSIIYSFHVMAFVFLSGYFFRPSDAEKLPSQTGKLIRSFLIPYAIYSIIAVCVLKNRSVETVFLGISYTRKLFDGVSSVGPVYFILMLFLVRFIYLLIERFSRNDYWKHGLCLAVSVAGGVLGQNGYWLPWCLDCAMYSVIFYHLGYCFRKYRLLEYLKNNLITYFALSVVWAYMIYEGSMELAIRDYGSYGLTILGAVSATVLLYMLSCYIYETFPVWITNFIKLVGQSTLYILIVHTLFNGEISSLAALRFGKGYIYHMGVTIIIQILLGMLVCILIRWMKKMLAFGCRKRLILRSFSRKNSGK